MSNSSQPLVSVCIGTYNRADYIRECLDSVLAQTYPNLEIIVVDDASTDRTVDLLRSYGNRIKMVLRTDNSGKPATPRNDGIKLAKGTYVAFLDSDDCWYPEKVARQVALMEMYPEVMLVHCYCRIIDQDGVPGVIRHEGVIPETGRIFEKLLRHCFIATSTMMIKADYFRQNTAFNEDVRLRAKEDYELFLRVAYQHVVGFIPEVMAYYRRSSSGISQEDRSWRDSPVDTAVQRHILTGRSVLSGVVDRRMLRIIIAEGLNENIEYWRGRGRPGRSLMLVGRALALSPFNAEAWGHLLRSLVRLCMAGSRIYPCVCRAQNRIQGDRRSQRGHR